MGTLAAKYTHCPFCGKLERHFVDGDTLLSCSCGRMSRASQWVTPMEGEEWIAQNLDREVSIVRRSFTHGRVSHGWFEEDKKVLIANVGEVDAVSEVVFILAEQEASIRNAAETFFLPQPYKTATLPP